MDQDLPRRLPNGNILAQARAESAGVIGDAVLEYTPDDEEYAALDEWLKSH
jgi:hypothetical protein